jgi:hypothetical protein
MPAKFTNACIVKHPCLIVLVWMVAFMMLSCEKARFDNQEDKGTNTEKSGAEEKADTTAARCWLTVGETLEILDGDAPDSLIIKADGIVGYIVGAIKGTTISDATFIPPFTVVSNLLIADDSLERDIARCMPVQLPLNSTTRAALNLVDNPLNLHRKIAVIGTIDEYFRVWGIKQVTDFSWMEESDSIIAPADTVDDKETLKVSRVPRFISGGR